MCIAKRIKTIADNEGITLSEIERVIGASNGVLSRAAKKGTDIQSKWVASIIDNYLKYSPDWLLTGNGDMLRGVSEASLYETKTTVPIEAKSIGDFKVREKEVLFQKVPLYEIEATAGIFAQGDLSPYVIDYISIPNAPKCDGAIVARGDSMEPIIKSGDLLLYKEHDPKNIMYGHIYIVDFDFDGDTMIVVKYIQKDKDPKRIVLSSENPRYQPIDIAIDQVRHLAMVKVSVAFHTMI
ncbi:MAG: S24 family peptidase [Bacteroidales bacterium]|uniref:S24 family peptidase n=1 Tax=Porphyromonas sp. TaxID=1924944 RepID=UPI0029718CD0|nr:S24 family peptidase [Porphyromonas sp.]MDD7438606.1 S24 family peptidase [Bacteroidales bacterium]MDY3067862.1 S24 family peptidase [Porphyromonas sp.]